MDDAAILGLPVLLVAASWAGWRLRRGMAEPHRSRDTVDAVRLVLSMLVTFAAIVLGLLTSSAKAHFDANRVSLDRYGIDLISLDQRLREFGPAADPARILLRAYTAAALADTWPNEPAPPGDYPRKPHAARPGSLESDELGSMLLLLDRRIAELVPTDSLQRQVGPLLSARMSETLHQRWALVASAQATITWPFMMVMALWLVLVFGLFGLTSPANGLVYATIAAAALSVSLAAWLILDLDAPLSGVLSISSEPLRFALAHMDAT